MKLFWNSLLISLGILLPTSTSIVLAESPKTPESIVIPEAVPVPTQSTPKAEETPAPEKTETTTAPDSKDSDEAKEPELTPEELAQQHAQALKDYENKPEAALQVLELSVIDSTVMLLRGESTVGKSVANQVKRQLPLTEDEQVVNYVRVVGNKLTTVAGRNDFEYEFYVVLDARLNAFALPGGKVFVNAGAILKTKSEAELAGLLAHELSHTVLSHGFQLVTEGNLLANVTQYLPLGGTVTNLVVLNYSRDMERQADALGTKILASGGYAVDGMHNLMVTLDKEERDRPVFAWLATHPDTKERISNIESLIESNGYNRYTYEGVSRHLEIQKQVAELLKQHKERENKGA